MAKIMKKIFMFVAAVAMLASCTQDFVENSNLPAVGDTTENVSWYDLGVKLVASIDDVTRVTVEGDTAASKSTMAWEQGDLVTVVYDGVVYEYACTNSGREGVFAPTSETAYIATLDATKPLVVYYNVKSVDPATMVATYDIPAEQVAGTLSNKLPLYSYTAEPVAVDNKLPLKMSALASVVEFDLKAASTWNVTSASFARTTRAHYLEAGFVAATDIMVDPVTGATAKSETSAESTTINLALSQLEEGEDETDLDLFDVANGLKMQFIVGPAKFQGTSVEPAEGVTAGVFTGACLKLYKYGNENFRKTMWNTPETLVDLSKGHKHVYQSASNILAGHKDGIRTVEDLWAFRNEHQNAVETYPVGTGFCDEDGVVYLHNDLTVEDWKYIGNTGRANLVNLRWRGLFDGQNHTITYTMKYEYDHQSWEAVESNGVLTKFSTSSAGFFNTICGGYIKNLNVAGTAKILYHQPVDVNAKQDHWTYYGGLVGQIHGGLVENCKNYVNLDATEHWSGKIRCGGIAGICKTTDADAEILDCDNYGLIDLRLTNPEKPQQSIPGGLVGIISDDANGYVTYMENCKNYGNVYVGNNNYAGNHFMGGCIGVASNSQKLEFSLVELYNYGEVKSFCTPTGKQILYIGGITGRLQYGHLIDCVNGEENTEKGAVSDIVYTSNGRYVTDEAKGETSPYNVTYMGGVVGNIDAGTTASVEGCFNYASVTTNAPANTCIGGVVGIQTATSKVEECENYGTVIINAPTDAPDATFGGGVLGKIGTSASNLLNKKTTECYNYGDVIIYAPAVYGNYFAGIVGAVYGGTKVASKDTVGATVSDCINEGNIIVLKDGGSGLYNRVGGCVGLVNSASVIDCENYGDVEIYSARGQNNTYGGVVAYVNQSDWTHEFTGNVNEGTVAVYCDFTPDRDTYTQDKWLVVGGVIGQINAKKGSVYVSGNENYGVVAAHRGDMLDENKEYFHIASVLGWWQNITGCKSFANNVVGGEVGTTTLDGHVAYDPKNPSAYEPGTITSTKLNNTADSDYYWEKWLYSQVGTTAKKPATSGNTFGN